MDQHPTYLLLRSIATYVERVLLFPAMLGQLALVWASGIATRTIHESMLACCRKVVVTGACSSDRLLLIFDPRGLLTFSWLATACLSIISSQRYS
ncbi:hypothetical protein K445DRAFT_82225 [Daldinia sp. EC12]|nr:hypothetical protein F4774DRAFT_13206 [Daldinia eschscholtzii]OTB20267.1 hypothetical protein K445DRAFT_82225 [Daldinia sp. EC12]